MSFLYIIALFLLLLYVILLSTYRKWYFQLKNNTDLGFSSNTKVTLIVPARNEEKNIANCLQSILAQTYPKNLLQIIVVDDFSTDSTSAIVNSFINNKVENLQLLELKNYVEENKLNSFKKKGIEIAITNSTGELIICTDADCIANENWVSSIVSFYEKTNAQFIACPVSLTPNLVNKNKTNCSFVEIFQTLDFLTLQGITAASVSHNFHTMCNGANIAYTKAAFNKVNGFSGIDNIASGDDMLLMYKIKKQFPEQIHYLKSEHTIVQSLTVPTWKEFFNQRIRWASKASFYEDKNIFYILVLVFLLNLFCLFLIGSLLFAQQNFMWVFTFFIIKSLIEFWFLLPVLKFFNQTFLAKWFFVCVPLHFIYTIVAGTFGKFGKYNWKNRSVH